MLRPDASCRCLPVRAVLRWAALCLVAWFGTSVATFGQSPSPRVIRVGVYHNPPIIVFADDGTYDGLSMIVLDEAAREHGWKIEPVRGIWQETFARLENGEIDLIAGIGISEEREERFAFSKETVVSSWGVIYRNPGVAINSILDLDGKRVAVARGNIHNQSLFSLLASYQKQAEILEEDDFYIAMERVQEGKADAVLLSRIFSISNTEGYDVVATGVVLDPVEIRYAVPPGGDTSLLDAIDATLRRLKNDPDSIFQANMRRLLEVPRGKEGLPQWLLVGLGSTTALVLVTALLSLVLRRQVRLRTEQLERKGRQLEREVSERKQAQDQLNRLAFYDGLTGLPNRFLFRDRLSQALTTAGDNQMVGLLFLDIDRFKTVNDSHGHSTGDALLRAMGERLRRSVREADTVSRLGGDEFTIILADLEGPAEAAAVCERIVESCSVPFHLWQEQVYATGSIGIALYPRDARDADGLLRAADAAMYFVKQHGRASYHFYSPEMTTQATERLMLETELREALTQGNLTLHYQPICELGSGRPLALEALLRLQHPTRGWLSPENVIPVAEETGLILDIGDRVLQQACLQMRRWLKEGIAPDRLSVNVSSRQFTSERLLRSVDQAIGISGLPSSFLQVELTESLFVDGGPASVSLIEELRGRDIRICIDDFGTGYSSLGYLQRLPIDTLKIDRSFIEDIPGDARAQRITSAILALASGLDLETVAEGIETKEQLAFLQRQGCRLGQGFLLCRPLPAAEMGVWLRSQLELVQQAG